MYLSWNLSRILCIENPTFRLRSCIQRNIVIAREGYLCERTVGFFCKGWSLSLSLFLFVFESLLHIDPSQFRDGTVSPIRSIAFEEKRKACVFQRLVSTDEYASMIVRSYFRGYLPWPGANSVDFPASRNGQLRRSSLVGIDFSAEWLLAAITFQ